MVTALGFIGAYVLLNGVASCLEKPVGKLVDAFQLNIAIRSGVLLLGAIALVVAPGATLPSLTSAEAGLGIGIVAGLGSVSYCYAMRYLSISLVVSAANGYVVITALLGVVVLGEALDSLAIAGLILMIAGVLVLSVRPRGAVSAGTKTACASRFLPLGVLAVNPLLVGVAAFLEKPALSQGLTPLQLNTFQAAGTVAVAACALAAQRTSLSLRRSTAEGLGLGAMFGLGSIFYFLGLRVLPVSVAAPVSNSYVILTVLLSAMFLGDSLTWKRAAGMLLTVAGAVILTVYGRP